MNNELSEKLVSRKEYILRVYHTARMAQVCSSQKDFAAKVKVSPATLSQALNGNPEYLTENLEMKVRYFARENGLEERVEKAQPLVQQQSVGAGVFIPEETRLMFENMTETIRIQAQLLAQFQGGAILGAGLYAPKNFQTDGK